MPINFYHNFNDHSDPPFRTPFHGHGSGESSPADIHTEMCPSAPSRHQYDYPLIDSCDPHNFLTRWYTSGDNTIIDGDRSIARARSRHRLSSPPSNASDSETQGYNSAPVINGLMTVENSQVCTRKNVTLGGLMYDVLDGDSCVVADKPTDIDYFSSDDEDVHSQDIESDQHEELLDGYAKLMDALPVANQTTCKVSLLDHAVTHIRELESSQTTLQSRLDQVENELASLRSIKEDLMRRKTGQHGAVVAVAAVADTQAVPSGQWDPFRHQKPKL